LGSSELFTVCKAAGVAQDANRPVDSIARLKFPEVHLSRPVLPSQFAKAHSSEKTATDWLEQIHIVYGSQRTELDSLHR